MYTFILTVIFTAVFYLLIPVLVRITAGKFPEKSAKKIVIINTVIIKLIFMVFYSSFNIVPALFWGSIGYTILKENKDIENTDKIICPHCNTKNKLNKEYCYVCGKKIKEKNINTESTTLNLSKQHIYCNYCGTKNNIKHTNCYMCGKELKK